MKKNAVDEKAIKKIAHGWATNYAEKIDAVVREHIANLSDDIAHAVYNFSVSLHKELMEDVAVGDMTPSAGSREFERRMKKFYENITDGTEID